MAAPLARRAFWSHALFVSYPYQCAMAEALVRTLSHRGRGFLFLLLLGHLLVVQSGVAVRVRTPPLTRQPPFMPARCRALRYRSITSARPVSGLSCSSLGKVMEHEAREGGRHHSCSAPPTRSHERTSPTGTRRSRWPSTSTRQTDSASTTSTATWRWTDISPDASGSARDSS